MLSRLAAVAFRLPVAAARSKRVVIGTRSFSGDSADKKKAGAAIDSDDELKSGNDAGGMSSLLNGPQMKQATMAMGGSVILYGISSIFYDLATSFLSLTPAVSLKYGFGLGALSAFGAGGTMYKLERCVWAKPEVAFAAGLSMLQSDEAVQSLLGGSVLHTGADLKVYKSRGGSMGVVDGSMTWRPPRIEALFSARGEFGGHVNALCIVEQQFIGAPAVEFCGLDIVSDSSSNQKHYQKRTRLVLKEVDAQAEEAHFAILDKMVGELDSMNREPR